MEQEDFSKYLIYNQSSANLTGEQIKYIKVNTFFGLQADAITNWNLTYIYDKMQRYKADFKKFKLHNLASFVSDILRRLKPHLDYETLELIKLRREYEEKARKEQEEQKKLAQSI